MRKMLAGLSEGHAISRQKGIDSYLYMSRKDPPQRFCSPQGDHIQNIKSAVQFRAQNPALIIHFTFHRPREVKGRAWLDY